MKFQVVVKLAIASSFVISFPSSLHALTSAEIFEKVKDSVVVVKALNTKGESISQGSGVLLPAGQIATNCHVLENGSTFQIIQEKQKVTAYLFGEDRELDVCLLAAKNLSRKPAQLARASNLKVGAAVYVVGAPMGLELALDVGNVAQLIGNPVPVIQTTSAIPPGSSGGGLFDENGELVGLATLHVKDGQSFNLAMPTECIVDVKPKQLKTIELAFSLRESGKWKDLLSLCERWTKSDPGSQMSWIFLGWAYRNLDRFENAIGAFHEALRFNHYCLGCWIDLGASYGRLERYNESIEAFHQALRIDPNNVVAWHGLGTAYISAGDNHAGVNVIQKLRSLDSETADKLLSFKSVLANTERKNNQISAAVTTPQSNQPAPARATISPTSSNSPSGSHNIEVPEHVKGDTYVVESVDLEDPKNTIKTERRVVAVEPGKIVIESKSLTSKKGTVRILEYTPEWNLIRSRNPDGEGSDFSPALKYFDFPLFTGKKWQQLCLETKTKTGSKRTHTINSVVGEWDVVTTPSGTFRAIKINTNTELFDYETGQKSTGKDISWYVPELRRSVKTETWSLRPDGSEENRIIQVLAYKIEQ